MRVYLRWYVGVKTDRAKDVFIARVQGIRLKSAHKGQEKRWSKVEGKGSKGIVRENKKIGKCSIGCTGRELDRKIIEMIDKDSQEIDKEIIETDTEIIVKDQEATEIDKEIWDTEITDKGRRENTDNESSETDNTDKTDKTDKDTQEIREPDNNIKINTEIAGHTRDIVGLHKDKKEIISVRQGAAHLGLAASGLMVVKVTLGIMVRGTIIVVVNLLREGREALNNPQGGTGALSLR